MPKVNKQLKFFAEVFHEISPPFYEDYYKTLDEETDIGAQISVVQVMVDSRVSQPFPCDYKLLQISHRIPLFCHKIAVI